MAHTHAPAGTSAGPSAGSTRHLAHASHCTQSAATLPVAVTADDIAAAAAAAAAPVDAADIDDDVATSTAESTAADATPAAGASKSTPEGSLATVRTANEASFMAVSKSPSESDLALLPAAAVAAATALSFWPFFLRRDAFP
jgi:hypothetical protein